MLGQGFVERYALKGRGGIYWQESDSKGENPLALAIKSAMEYPNYFRPWLERLGRLRIEDLDSIVARVPAEWMSGEARQFCIKLMSLTIERLKAVQL